MSSLPDAPSHTADVADPDRLDRLRYAGVFALLFLFGTETFLVSPLLPTIAKDIDVSEAAAASSVTAYVLVYAVCAPFLGVLSDRFGRRRALVAGSLLFVVSNVGAAVATGLPLLVLSRAGGRGGGAPPAPARGAAHTGKPPRPRR
ncbi:MFS transporter, partial [Streptomyces hokutonensis]|uniref:MFS transporter n=1 Tax=Streptomyces hokutonensis TaxID=1306990 RepID=UPI0036CD2923